MRDCVEQALDSSLRFGTIWGGSGVIYVRIFFKSTEDRERRLAVLNDCIDLSRHIVGKGKRLLKRLGLPGHLHTFRHSFISFAAQQGVSERVLRAWVGHVDREILDWYFHLADEQSQAAMQRLSRSAASLHAASETDVNSAQFQHSSEEKKHAQSAT